MEDTTNLTKQCSRSSLSRNVVITIATPTNARLSAVRASSSSLHHSAAMQNQPTGAIASTSTSSSPSKAHLPDPSLPAPPLLDDEQGFTADQLIARQAELEQAAREAVPFSFTKGGCTYERGYIRQPVFACRTCGGGGVCAGCSVGCHADHDLVELFAKRAFRCDCGTLSLCRGKSEKEATLAPCSLRSSDLSFAPQNDENRYNKNFDGAFCRCERGKTYNAEKEEETMLQCLCCEDWIHESCCTLRPSRAIDDFEHSERSLADGPLVEHESFDLFICNECLQLPANKVLRYYLGARGWIVCVPERDGYVLPREIDGIKAVNVIARGNGWEHPWKVFGLEKDATEHAVEPAAAPTPAPSSISKAVKGASSETDDTATLKRLADDEDASRAGDGLRKRAKLVGGLPVYDNFSDDEEQDTADGQDARVITSPPAKAYVVGGTVCIEPDMPLFATEEKVVPRFDIFLAETFRDRICRCASCLDSWTHLPFILAAEETYSPPRSQSSSQQGDNLDDGRSDGGTSQTSSTYDLGLAALNRLPRERMMESLQAYNKMRDALFQHLRPFADQGKVVDAESVREFFRKQKEEQDAARNGST